MNEQHGTAGMPAARPVEERVYRSDPSGDGTPWYRDVDAWLPYVMGAALALAWSLTDLAPAVLVATGIVMATRTVWARRGGTRWWTWLEVIGWPVLVVVVLTLSTVASGLSGGELAAQLVGGALVGVVVVAVVAAIRRRRAAPAGPPTGA